ncbi:serine/arginine-rich splicing factor 9-like [Discoglossus pictus]
MSASAVYRKQLFTLDLCKTLLLNLEEEAFRMDCIHGFRAGCPSSGERLRDVIAKFHYYETKDLFMKAARSGIPEVDDGQPSIYADLSPTTLYKRSLLKPLLEVILAQASPRCTLLEGYLAPHRRIWEAARAGSRNGRIYVGNLPADVREKELEKLFHRYGRIRSVELKNRGRCSSSPFAFIKFQDPRDAEDAVFGRNGYDFGSCRLRVEFQRPFRGSRGDGGGYGAPRGRNGPPSRRSDFRVLVSGLPPSGSWQDLKDHMRKAGDVCYADVHKDGMGIVEFIRKEDMEYALRKLDDTKFRSHEGENYYIRVCPERNASYSRSRSRSRGRDSTYQSLRSPSPFRPY